MKPFSLKVLPLEMLDSFKGLNVTDPKDKVFALLGFVALDGPFPDLITANYTKTTEQVYLDVARFLILTEQTLHVLNMRHSPPSMGCQRSMPTWVPDWQTGTTNKWIAHQNDSDREEAVVSSNLVSQLVDFSPDGKLLAKGFELDVVADVFDNGLFPFWNGPEGSNPFLAFQNFAKYILSGPSVNKETPLSAYFRLAIYNNLQDHNEPDLQGNRFFKDAASFLRYIFMKIQTGNVFPPGSFIANNYPNMALHIGDGIPRPRSHPGSEGATRESGPGRGPRHRVLRRQIHHHTLRPSPFPHRMRIAGPRPGGNGQGRRRLSPRRAP